MQFDDKIPFVPTIKPLLQNVGMASLQIIYVPVLGQSQKNFGWLDQILAGRANTKLLEINHGAKEDLSNSSL
jgi:hypothetical protein